jgi:hypothetical protein
VIPSSSARPAGPAGRRPMGGALPAAAVPAAWLPALQALRAAWPPPRASGADTILQHGAIITDIVYELSLTVIMDLKAHPDGGVPCL